MEGSQKWRSTSSQKRSSTKETQMRSLWCAWSPVLCCRITTSPGQNIVDKGPASIVMALTPPRRRLNMATQSQVCIPPPKESGTTISSSATSGLLAAMTPWNHKKCLRPRVTRLNVTSSRFSFKCGVLC